jgi:hypothetical protein
MNDIFIKEIKVEESRNIKDLQIPLYYLTRQQNI